MPRITANLPTDAILQRAKVAAVKARQPLAHWAGEAVVARLNNAKEEPIMTPCEGKPRASNSTAPVKHGAPKPAKRRA